MMWSLIEGRSQFFGRLFVSCAVLGSALALGSVCFTSYQQLRQRDLLRAQDQPILRKLDQSAASPLVARIQEQESLLVEIKDVAVRTDAKRRLAKLYGDLAIQEISHKALAKSEHALQRAMQLDPSNSRYVADMGALYSRSASTQKEPDQRCTLYQSSAQYYREASSLVPNEHDRIQHLNTAVLEMLSAAKTLESQGLPERAVSILKRTLEWAPEQAPATAEVNRFIGGVR
jgi:tetratricopeptide (TPR) repeat protein